MRDALKQLQYSMSSTVRNYTDIMFSYMVFYETSSTLVKPECFNFGGLFQCLWHYSPLIRLQKSQFLIFQPRCELWVLKWQLKLFFSRMCGILDPRKDGFSDKRYRKKSKIQVDASLLHWFLGTSCDFKSSSSFQYVLHEYIFGQFFFFEGETKVNGPLCTTRNRNVFV